MSAARKEPGALQIAAYAAPALAIAALGQPFYQFAPTLYVRDLGLPAAAVGLIVLIARLVDGAGDLAVGLASDRTGGRFGRRKPWIVAGAPLAAIAAFMALNPPEAPGLIYFGFWTIAVSLAWALLNIPLNAWGAELSSDYRGRTRVAAFREGLTLVGVIAATATVAALSETDGGLVAALAVLGVAVAVATPVTAVIAGVGAPDPAPTPLVREPVRTALRGVLANALFRRLLTAQFVNALANALPATLFLLFVGERLGRPDLQGALIGGYFVAGLLSVPVWSWIGSRVPKHRAWCAAMVWACAVFALALLVDGPEDLPLYIAVALLSGLALGADVVLPASMQADVVEAEALARGADAPSRTGLTFAMWSLATKIALGMAGGVGFGLVGIAGYDPALTDQPAAVGPALTLAYAVLPLALKAVSIALMWRFPLDALELERRRERPA
jgi:GPH family glycoside/pentoside/hexuronide:cation symporter